MRWIFFSDKSFVSSSLDGGHGLRRIYSLAAEEMARVKSFTANTSADGSLAAVDDGWDSIKESRIFRLGCIHTRGLFFLVRTEPRRRGCHGCHGTGKKNTSPRTLAARAHAAARSCRTMTALARPSTTAYTTPMLPATLLDALSGGGGAGGTAAVAQPLPGTKAPAAPSAYDT